MYKLLLIEDDLYIREIYGSNIGLKCNAEVDLASSGDEAIKILRRNIKYDFIVSDHSMPNGTGLDVLRYLETSDLKIPFLFFSSEVDLQVDTTYIAYNGFVHKFDVINLYKQVQEGLSRLNPLV